MYLQNFVEPLLPLKGHIYELFACVYHFLYVISYIDHC